MSTFITNDNGVDRPMTDDEVSAFLVEKASMEAQEQQRLQAIADKESAIAKLTTLGLTVDEATALFG